MQIETVVDEANEKREEYFTTLYDELDLYARLVFKMTPLVSFLPQTLRRWGHDLGFNLERGGLWGKNDLTFGMGLGRWHSGGVTNSILKLNFGAYPFSVEQLREGLSPEVLSFMVRSDNRMSGEFKSYAPGDQVWVNCWANSHKYGGSGSNLDSRNPYALVDVVARTIRQGR